MANKISRSSALLNMIQKAPTAPSVITEGLTEETAPAPPSQTTTSLAPKRTTAPTGKRVTIFLHDADRKIVRELVAYFAGQGKRVSESLVIKSALRAAKPGEDLLRAYQQAAQQDQRFK